MGKTLTLYISEKDHPKLTDRFGENYTGKDILKCCLFHIEFGEQQSLLWEIEATEKKLELLKKGSDTYGVTNKTKL